MNICNNKWYEKPSEDWPDHTGLCLSLNIPEEWLMNIIDAERMNADDSVCNQVRIISNQWLPQSNQMVLLECNLAKFGRSTQTLISQNIQLVLFVCHREAESQCFVLINVCFNGLYYYQHG